MNRMKNQRMFIESASIVGFCFALVIGLSMFGDSQRVFATRPHLVTLDRPGDAYSVWTKRHLHGRTLYLFDRHINADALSQPGDENFVTAAIKAGVVRRIFHVIPDVSWAEVEHNLASFPASRRFDGLHRLTTHEGVPIVIMRLRDIRRTAEPVLISINGKYWADSEERTIVGLLGNGVLKSDLTTLFDPLPESLTALERHFEKAP